MSRTSRPLVGTPATASAKPSRVLVTEEVGTLDLIDKPAPLKPREQLVTPGQRDKLTPVQLAELATMERTRIPALPVATPTGVRWRRPVWLDQA